MAEQGFLLRSLGVKEDNKMILLKNPKIDYVPTRTSFFSLTDEELEQKLMEGYQKTGGKDGAYFMRVPPDVKVTATIDGKEEKISIGALVCKYYHVDKLNNKVFADFKKELADDVLLLIFDEETRRVDVLKK